MPAKRIKTSSEVRPETLTEAVRVFADEDVSLKFMVKLRWGGMDQVCCPRCGSVRVRFISTRRVWECRETHVGQPKRFSLKTGTVMEDSPLPLGTWLVAIWLEANAKNSISSYEVHRSLGITQKSAWFMQQRIRLAMQTGNFFDKLSGEVEADETFVGGKAEFMHADKRKRVVTGTGPQGSGKTAVMGLLQRGTDKSTSQVRTLVISDTRRKTIHPIVRQHVEPGTAIYTDAHYGYKGMTEYMHAFVDHAERYVVDRVHTNGLENFWSLFKRCIKGTHIAVEPFHLFRYLDAECFRFNHRETNDGGRFLKVLGQVEGKRLTYKALISASESETWS